MRNSTSRICPVSPMPPTVARNKSRSWSWEHSCTLSSGHSIQPAHVVKLHRHPLPTLFAFTPTVLIAAPPLHESNLFLPTDSRAVPVEAPIDCRASRISMPSLRPRHQDWLITS